MLNILMDFENFHSIKIYLMSNVKVGMKCNINMLVSFLFVTYNIKKLEKTTTICNYFLMEKDICY